MVDELQATGEFDTMSMGVDEVLPAASALQLHVAAVPVLAHSD